MNWTAIRSSGSPTEADELALVLVSAGIANRVAATEEGFTLSVPDADADRARAVLASFAAEESPRRREASVADRPVPWFVGILVASLMVAGFVVTDSPRAFERGAAVAGLMRAEPWRAVTALTLHLDVAHVAGNALATAVLLPFVAQRLGAGVGLLLVVLAGAGGNLLAALAQAPAHSAVGASTATFGAVGMLGALRLLPGPGESRRLKMWTVPAASLLLLTLTGTGRGVDVLAHVTGFLSGAALGLAAAPVFRRPLGLPAQVALGTAAALIVAGAWLRAG